MPPIDYEEEFSFGQSYAYHHTIPQQDGITDLTISQDDDETFEDNSPTEYALTTRLHLSTLVNIILTLHGEDYITFAQNYTKPLEGQDYSNTFDFDSDFEVAYHNSSELTFVNSNSFGHHVETELTFDDSYTIGLSLTIAVETAITFECVGVSSIIRDTAQFSFSKDTGYTNAN